MLSEILFKLKKVIHRVGPFDCDIPNSILCTFLVSLENVAPPIPVIFRLNCCWNSNNRTNVLSARRRGRTSIYGKRWGYDCACVRYLRNYDLLGYDTVYQSTKSHGITSLMFVIVNCKRLNETGWYRSEVSGTVFRTWSGVTPLQRPSQIPVAIFSVPPGKYWDSTLLRRGHVLANPFPLIIHDSSDWSARCHLGKSQCYTARTPMSVCLRFLLDSVLMAMQNLTLGASSRYNWHLITRSFVPYIMLYGSSAHTHTHIYMHSQLSRVYGVTRPFSGSVKNEHFQNLIMHGVSNRR
jgi:hypothetical protein